MKLLTCLILFIALGHPCCGYVPPEVRQRWKDQGYTIEDALKTVERGARKGRNVDDLFWAVKFIDRAGNKLYPEIKDREALLERANGSWELRLAVNSDRDRKFYPHPEFRALAMAFITVDHEYFGKGIATDSSFCFVSLGGPSTRNVRTRQVYMNYEDYYINGRQVPGWDLSYYIRGYSRNWVAAERERPPLAFTVVAANDKVMVVRGSKTGGMAIFRRIEDDMSPAAFGFPNNSQM